MVQKPIGFEWSVWTAVTVAEYLTRVLRKRKRPVNPRTVCRWAGEGRIPARWQRDGKRGFWCFDPEEVKDFALGRFGGRGGKFKLAYVPKVALQQIRDLLRDICNPEHLSEWNFETGQQENLCTAIRQILVSPHYAPIWPEVRRLAKTYRGNPALNCLESVGGLYN